jgi:hypothetical protein
MISCIYLKIENHSYYHILYIFFIIINMATPSESKTYRTFVFSDIKPKPFNRKQSKEQFMRTILDTVKCESYDFIENLKESVATGKCTDNNVPVEKLLRPLTDDATVYHDGYYYYLLEAWRNDCGVVVDPAYLANIILLYICKSVNKSPEEFRKIFTNSAGKIIIIIPDFDIEHLVNRIKALVPKTLDVDRFIPKFHHEPENYNIAMYGLFAETVQAYYQCCVDLCSIPKVQLCVDMHEWDALINIVNYWISLFKDTSLNAYMVSCRTKIDEFIKNLDNSDYWKGFFGVERCGSGGDVPYGHILHFIKDIDTNMNIYKLPKMISKYKYENKIEAREEYFLSGIMYSRLNSDDILIPMYDYTTKVPNPEACLLTSASVAECKTVLECLETIDSSSITDIQEEKLIRSMDLLVKFNKRSYNGVIFKKLIALANQKLVLAFFNEYIKDPYAIGFGYYIAINTDHVWVENEKDLLFFIIKEWSEKHQLKLKNFLQTISRTHPELYETVWHQISQGIMPTLKVIYTDKSMDVSFFTKKFTEAKFTEFNLSNSYANHLIDVIEFMKKMATLFDKDSDPNNLVISGMPDKLSRCMIADCMISLVMGWIKNLFNWKTIRAKYVRNGKSFTKVPDEQVLVEQKEQTDKNFKEITVEKFNTHRMLMKIVRQIMELDNIPFDVQKMVHECVALYDYSYGEDNPLASI